MAKQTLKAGRKEKSKETKSGKGKWILLAILLLLLILIALAYFFDFGKTLFFNEEVSDITGDPVEISLEAELKKAEELDQVIRVEETQTVEEPPPPVPVAKPVKKYYVKVEDCIGITCEREVIRFLKQEKLPYTKMRSKRKTEYHELISSSVFSRQSASEKIQLLEETPGVMGDPRLVRENRRYRISMGHFLDKEVGIRTKSGLADLYPKIQIDFELRTSNRYYTVNSILAGPFKKGTAEKVKNRLQLNPEYETSTVTRR